MLKLIAFSLCSKCIFSVHLLKKTYSSLPSMWHQEQTCYFILYVQELAHGGANKVPWKQISSKWPSLVLVNDRMIVCAPCLGENKLKLKRKVEHALSKQVISASNFTFVISSLYQFWKLPKIHSFIFFTSKIEWLHENNLWQGLNDSRVVNASFS